jgi:cytochrome c oxidase cbb3-type subunit III
MKRTVVLLLAMLGIAACGWPGRRVEPAVIAPDQLHDFAKLYSNNCAGCHGTNGQAGAAVGLGDPVYLAFADDATIRRVTAEGVPGTSMPPFAQKAGGLLTDAQVEIIVNGIRTRWAKPGVLGQDNPPSYKAQTPGDPKRGETVFTTFCSSCHGPTGRGGQKAGSIVDGSYLALVSDQHLRTIVVVGLPALGAPDWRGDLPGKPLSETEVTDVVAWLAAQRPSVGNPSLETPSLSTELNRPGGY